MPSRVSTSSIPDAARRGRRVVDGTARMLALRFLLGAPGSTRPEIAEGAGISVATAQTALLTLEDLGYVTTDAGGSRNGRLIRYVAVRDAVLGDLEALTDWLLS